MREGNKQLKNNKSAKSLLWFSGIIILIGLNVKTHGDFPALELIWFSLAVFFSTFALILGSNKTKIMSLIVIISSILFTIESYSELGNSYKRRYRAAVSGDLRNLRVVEEAYFFDHKIYSTDLETIEKALNTKIHQSKGVTIEIVSADEKCFKAKGNHVKSDETYWVDCEGKLYRQEKGSSKLNPL